MLSVVPQAEGDYKLQLTGPYGVLKSGEAGISITAPSANVPATITLAGPVATAWAAGDVIAIAYTSMVSVRGLTGRRWSRSHEPPH
jgi:putative intracellular protease/amidase